jgi:hypothetical protein
MKAEWLKTVPFVNHHHHQWVEILKENFFEGGSITGIEIAGGSIRLVRWVNENGVPVRKVAEEESLMLLAQRIMGY